MILSKKQITSFELKTAEFVAKHLTVEPPNRNFLPKKLLLSFSREKYDFFSFKLLIQFIHHLRNDAP